MILLLHKAVTSEENIYILKIPIISNVSLVQMKWHHWLLVSGRKKQNPFSKGHKTMSNEIISIFCGLEGHIEEAKNPESKMLSSALILFPFMWGKLLSLGRADLPIKQGRGAETADREIEMTHAFFWFVFPENVNIQTKLFLLGRPVQVPQRSCSRSSSCSSPFLQQELLPQVTHLKMCHGIYF